ncbi:MAG: hypothetical protein M1820_009928 [Bogoriella megaspora]|nr:MAG: hypothetical protein M1820_009928 [Bogoriella megaspora]
MMDNESFENESISIDKFTNVQSLDPDERSRLKELSKHVLAWYNGVSSRRVDLVGDYAGNELFLVEGDSLLLRIFSDPLLDFHDGFQLLHACYLVESFLRGLIQRKCNFHIAFFGEHEELSVPSGVSDLQHQKFLLARTAIIRHLEKHLPRTSCNIELHKFLSINSIKFQDYLSETGIYFVMCHDGARNMQSEGTLFDKSLDDFKKVVARRTVISRFVRQGYNVALINGLGWQDTKIMTIVLEAGSWTVPDFDLAASLPKLKNSACDLNDVISQSPKFTREDEGLTERDILGLLVIRQLSADSKIGNAASATASVAFLQHLALLRHLPLYQRSLKNEQANDEVLEFLSSALPLANALVRSSGWVGTTAGSLCNIGDMMDGRLLNACYRCVRDGAPPLESSPSKTTFDRLLKLAGLPRREGLLFATAPATEATESVPSTVLPFANEVFDKHLQCIRLTVDDDASSRLPSSSAKIFSEVSHWHNLKPLKTPKTTAPVLDARQQKWVQKRKDWWLAEMHKYAESLTDAVGVGLNPELVGLSVNPKKNAQATEGIQSSALHRGAGNKNNQQKNAKKTAMLEDIAARKKKTEEEEAEKAIKAWHAKCKAIDDAKDPHVRFLRANNYLKSIEKSKKDVTLPEVRLYVVNCLLFIWIDSRAKAKDSLDIAALIFEILNRLSQNTEYITNTIAVAANDTNKAMGLPFAISNAHYPDRKLAFRFLLPMANQKDLKIPLPSKEFQLLHCGPYMDRDIDAVPDPRVPRFTPDGWQRNVLDSIDANKSLLVVAPTSAGKTFISFYAMKKVLSADEDGVLVYVAPTKALVNQIAAEIQARFKKNFQNGGKSVWAIHTRDYRLNNPIGCQVLVTVPHVLQIMLLAPSHAKTWAQRVKRIIFDEVHSIGQADDGLVWEQLLLLAPCPIIALSATVGNPESFNDWLVSSQGSIGHDMVMIRHPYRYSDLRKFIYQAPKSSKFEGLREDSTKLTRLGLDDNPGFSYVHPVASLIDRTRGIPDDLNLEPRDCFLLWQAMSTHRVRNGRDWDPTGLLESPSDLPDVIRKIDVIQWETRLKELLRTWMADRESPFDDILQDLSKPIFHTATTDNKELAKTTLSLLANLHEQNALPALLFNYSRGDCERIAISVLRQLERVENEYKNTSIVWKEKVKEKETWEKAEEAKAAKSAKKPIKSKKGRRDEDDPDTVSKQDIPADAAGADTNPLASFDPNEPIDKFSFANKKVLLRSELADYAKRLNKRGVPTWLIEALERGIGVHHAGLNRAYRQVVEMLFRRGFLRVCIATGTLALGINMPTRSCVFLGDSVFLTALNFRQAAGRAGRRGFDLLGNVIFHGVSTDKVYRLISSRLPELNGHFPITTTLVLRLFTLLYESKNSPFAVRSINSLLSQPRLYMGSSERRFEVLHHLRFSIEYLRRQHLLGSSGAPLNFAGLVSHLYYTENSSFAFHALLKDGYFHNLCRNIRTKRLRILETLMLVLAHCFGRRECRQASMEFIEHVIKRSSSVVFLPKLPAAASKILQDHNKQTLDTFTTYAKTFADQHIKGTEEHLPLTSLKVGGNDSSLRMLPQQHSPQVRSAFVALSGHTDAFESISDLCRTSRDGIFLEESVIPYIPLAPSETPSPLNAYLFDFYQHGDITALEKANGIRSGDVWFWLNDFSLVLATIITSLRNFMKIDNLTEIEMMEVKGIAEGMEDGKENQMVEAEKVEGDGPTSVPQASKQSAPKNVATKKTKKEIAENWEDVEDDEEKEETSAAHSSTGTSTPSVAVNEDLGTPAWDDEQGDGGSLRLVLEAFTELKKEFDTKFKVIWA